MDMTGTQVIPAPISRVWEALRDPEILRRSVPGCETISRTSPTTYSATIKAKVGPVEARFSGEMTLEAEMPPYEYTLRGKGSSGIAGFASGHAFVTLAETTDNKGTVLAYAAKGAVGGKIAQIGGRLLDTVAKSLADTFFTRFSALLTEEAGAVPSPPEAP